MPRLGLVALAAVILCASCKRAPRCRGGPSDDELRRLAELVQAGEEPCPGQLRPSIEVDAAGIAVNGVRIARSEELPAERAGKIERLYAELKENREIWKQTHPAAAFDSEATIRLAPATGAVVGSSTVVSTAWAGYREQRILSGGTELRFSYFIPGPPSVEETPAPVELHLRRTSDGRQLVSLRRGGVVVASAAEPLAFEQVPAWVSTRCDDGPTTCPDIVHVEPSGDFVVSLTLLKNVLDVPKLAARRPMVRFQGDLLRPLTRMGD